MQNINQVIIEGNISCDPLLRYTSDEKSVTNFNMYVDSKYKNKNYKNRSCENLTKYEDFYIFQKNLASGMDRL